MVREKERLSCFMIGIGTFEFAIANDLCVLQALQPLPSLKKHA